jgi:hypothetical protein
MDADEREWDQTESEPFTIAFTFRPHDGMKGQKDLCFALIPKTEAYSQKGTKGTKG